MPTPSLQLLRAKPLDPTFLSQTHAESISSSCWLYLCSGPLYIHHASLTPPIPPGLPGLCHLQVSLLILISAFLQYILYRKWWSFKNSHWIMAILCSEFCHASLPIWSKIQNHYYGLRRGTTLALLPVSPQPLPFCPHFPGVTQTFPYCMGSSRLVPIPRRLFLQIAARLSLPPSLPSGLSCKPSQRSFLPSFYLK